MAGMEMTRPLMSLRLDLLEYSSSYVLLVPSSIHENTLGLRLQTRREIIDVPIPALLSDSVAIGIFSGAKQIISSAQVRAKARDSDSSSNAIVLATAFE
jgi:hypothetical protein